MSGQDTTHAVSAEAKLSEEQLEKIEGLRKIGVDHACGLMIPADSMSELEDQIEWFGQVAVQK